MAENVSQVLQDAVALGFMPKSSRGEDVRCREAEAESAEEDLPPEAEPSRGCQIFGEFFCMSSSCLVGHTCEGKRTGVASGIAAGCKQEHKG